MKRIFFLVASLVFFLPASIPARAQFAVPPPAAEVALRSPTELNELLGPIALYPDPLIAQLLPAAILPSDIVMAHRYIQSGGDPNQIDAQPWSSSVRAMAHYPDVLKWMDDNLAWTTQVGQAFLYQPQDVMDAIQRLRAQAQALGNLQTTAQQRIEVDDGNIEIVPANPEIIYVPVYQPEIVFHRRPVFGAGPFISFGGGFSIGLWLNHDWDWRNHRVVVWDREHFRPHDWWYRPGPERFRTVEGRNDFHVWQPRRRLEISPADRQDRGWEARPSVRVESPRVESVRPSEPERRPEPQRRPEPERRPEPARPTETRREEPARRPAPAPVQVSPPTHAGVPAPQPNGALVGVRSARDARDYSNRGQQSRQVQHAPPSGAGANRRETPSNTAPQQRQDDSRRGKR